MLGWIVWLVESALCIVASCAAGVALYPDRGALDRFVAAGLIASGSIVLVVTGCGIASRLEPVTVTLASTLLFAAMLYASARYVGGVQVLRARLHDSLIEAPRRLLRDTLALREVGVLTLVPALSAAGISTLMVWYFRSWTWDPVWYHDAKIYLAIQNEALTWFDTPNEWTQGNPHNIELFAIWNCVFQRDIRLDDSPQLPFLFLGALVVSAWARRTGASRPISVAAGATWMALPPIFLQAPSSHVDIGWNTFFTAAVYLMTDKPAPRERWLSFLAWGLFLGSKYTGLFHLGLLMPYIVVRVGYEVWKAPTGRRLARSVDVGASVLLVLAVGAPKYIENFLGSGNPMWPWVLRIASLGVEFPGRVDPGVAYQAAPGVNPTFFGAPNAFWDMLRSWYDAHPFYCPDVRHGGFGPVYRWLLLPCMIAVMCDLARGRNWRQTALLAALFVQSLLVPVAYMSRFVMGAASAACVAFAIVHGQTRWRLGRIALSGALVVLTWHGYREGYRGFIVYPRYFAESRAADAATRTAMQIDTFLWPRVWALARERELNVGDVLAYDESVHFLGELWNHDLDARVEFVSSQVAPEQYVARVRALAAKWVGVRAASPQEAALRAAGAEFLFHTPLSAMAMYRMPR